MLHKYCSDLVPQISLAPSGNDNGLKLHSELLFYPNHIILLDLL